MAPGIPFKICRHPTFTMAQTLAKITKTNMYANVVDKNDLWSQIKDFVSSWYKSLSFLISDSKSMAKLKSAVEGKNRQNMKDLKHMTACMDTSRWVLRTINFMCMVFPYKSKTSQDCKTLPRVHFIGCQGAKLFLPKDCYKFCQKLSCQNLSFWVVSQFEIELCHKLSFWVLSQFEFMTF